MGAFKPSLLLAMLGMVCLQQAVTSGMAQSTGAAVASMPSTTKTSTARPAAAPAASKGPAAPALPAGAESRASAMRKRAPDWVQREGYVPVPEALTPKTETAASNALPPANSWGNFATIDPDKPFANDPTGTNVFADTKYAPAAVRAAVEAQQNPDFDTPLPPASGSVGGMGSGMGGGMTGGMGGGMTGGASAQAMLQQSYAPSAPVAAPPSSGDGVFTGGNNAFNNRYTPSVGNAMGSSDLLVQMVIESPEQDVSKSTDALRQMMGQISNTPPNRIFVYQTRTISNPNGGPPFTSITFLFKNNVDAERARQQAVFSSTDMMRGFIDNVATTRVTRLRITPGSIKVSSAVNDGGAGPAAGAGAMPGQLPGQMGMMPVGGNGMMMPMAGMPPAAAAPPAPTKSSADRTAASLLSAAAFVLVMLAV